MTKMAITYLLLFIATITSSAFVSNCEDYFQKVIYVDSKNGTSESVCWTGGEKQPCSSLDLALEGARQLNSTVVIPAGIAEDRNSEDPSSTTCNIHYTNIATDTITGNSTSCPPWYFYNDSECECGSRLDGLVHCDQNMEHTLVLQSYCMTYDNNTGITVAGACLYNFFNISNTKPYLSNYHKLPKTAEDFNDWMCGRFNRQGQLCGQCIEDQYLPTYSYDVQCRNCTYSRYNWAKYTMVAFGPLTLFLFIVLFFRISVTSPPLVAFVTVSQINSAPLLVRLMLIATEDNAIANTLVRVTSSLKGIWNLDFFRTLLPPVCLQLTTLETLALDYFIAFYPMALIVVIYSINQLYEHDNRLFRWLWKPFYTCCVRFRRNIDVKATLIDTFATFFSLSIVKFLSVSFDILVPTHLFGVHGNKYRTFYLYYNATMEYFGEQHRPYAIVALLILHIAVIFPFLMLLLYQCQRFQNCLSYFRLRSRALHTCVSAFQGCLKDGTNGTHDSRYFAALALGLGLLLYTMDALIQNIYLWTLYAVVFIATSICYTIIQPYKLATYNTVASGMFLILAIDCLLVEALFAVSTNAPFYLYLTIIFLAVADTLPQLYIIGVFVYWFICKKKVPQMVLQKLHIWKPRHNLHIGFEELVPDRLANPGEYENMLPNPLEEEDENDNIRSNSAY